MASKEYPKLEAFGVLLARNNRSKAYIQSLAQAGFLPQFAVILDKDSGLLPEQTQNDLRIHDASNQKFMRVCPEAGIQFDEKEPIERTLSRHHVRTTVLPTLDVNHESVVETLKKQEASYLVYSGPGGTLLRKEVLNANKFFIHVHPGWLPGYRGSTTIYYALLKGQAVGCSVIFLDEEIDKGPVLYRKVFESGRTKDMDYVYDPCVRAAALMEFFKLNYGKSPKALDIHKESSQEFYIIHPVLKHLAILKSEKALC